MENKKIAQQFIENLFVNNDLAYEVVDENIRVNWPGFGMEDLLGKQILRNFLNEGGPDKVIEQKVTHLIAEVDVVIGTGSMITERNGKTEKSHFADVYTIKNGKITNLTSYMVMDQSSQNTKS